MALVSGGNSAGQAAVFLAPKPALFPHNTLWLRTNKAVCAGAFLPTQDNSALIGYLLRF